ncbi:MAG: hypothetical protein IJ193_06455 [Bacilli bacterium]|nr:hypothetical protein [Bacilli bacterium]
MYYSNYKNWYDAISRAKFEYSLYQLFSERKTINQFVYDYCKDECIKHILFG